MQSRPERHTRRLLGASSSRTYAADVDGPLDLLLDRPRTAEDARVGSHSRASHTPVESSHLSRAAVQTPSVVSTTPRALVTLALASAAALAAPTFAIANVCGSPFSAVAVARSAASQQRIALLSSTHIHHSTDGGARWTSVALRSDSVQSFLVNEDGTTLLAEGVIDDVRLRIVAPDGTVRLDRTELSMIHVACAHGVIAYIESHRLRVSRDLGRTWSVATVPSAPRSVSISPNALTAVRDLRIEPNGAVRVLENFADDETGTARSVSRELTCTRVGAGEQCRHTVYSAANQYLQGVYWLAPNGAMISRDTDDSYRLHRGRTWTPLAPQPRVQSGSWLANDTAMLLFHSPSTVWRLDGTTFSTVTTRMPIDARFSAIDAVGRLVVVGPRSLVRRDAPHTWNTLVDCPRGTP